MTTQSPYPVSLVVDYPDHRLNRLTTFFRIFTVIPIIIILALLAGSASTSQQAGQVHVQYGAPEILFLPTMPMLLVRRKYPRWWFDWNLSLTRFSYRIVAYLCLLRDE
jgi:hypothetical protein